MELLYTSKNKIKFTSISDRYQVPKAFQYKMSAVHSSLIEYVSTHFRNTNKYKQQVTDALNILTYCILENEVPPFDWSVESPLGTMPDTDMDRVEKVLGGLFLKPDAIEWDVKATDSSIVDVASLPKEPVVTEVAATTTKSAFKSISKQQPVSMSEMKSAIKETKKEDLYIKAPTYPQFDYNRPWLSKQDGPDKLVIYTTLPEIPRKQNQISITTNVNQMTDAELLALYPNVVIRTRAAVLYEEISDLKFDSDLGVILPIEGYSEAELIDNIIRYPHLYKLKRCVGEEIRSFYNDIEIDGELYPVTDIWDTLPESKIIPRQSEFIKEYIVRRYILEEEKGIHHNYPMYGTLDPFLTLFMPMENYIERGYKDATSIVKQCVTSRVSFKQSRNPVLRRLGIVV